MDMKELKALRPAERTSHAIITALSRIKARAAIVAERTRELLAARPAKLLSAETTAVETLERDLAAARLEAEQLEALERALGTDLAEVRLNERHAELTKRVEHLAARVPALRRAILEEYPVLAARIAEICHLERAYHNEAHALRSTVHAAGEAGIGVPLLDLIVGYTRSDGSGVALCQDVVLPGVAPAGPPVLGLAPPRRIYGPDVFGSAETSMAVAAGRAYGPQGLVLPDVALKASGRRA